MLISIFDEELLGLSAYIFILHSQHIHQTRQNLSEHTQAQPLPIFHHFYITNKATIYRQSYFLDIDIQISHVGVDLLKIPHIRKCWTLQEQHKWLVIPQAMSNAVVILLSEPKWGGMNI